MKEIRVVFVNDNGEEQKFSLSGKPISDLDQPSKQRVRSEEEVCEIISTAIMNCFKSDSGQQSTNNATCNSSWELPRKWEY